MTSGELRRTYIRLTSDVNQTFTEKIPFTKKEPTSKNLIYDVEIMKGTLTKHIHTTTSRLEFIENKHKIESDIFRSKIKILEYGQSKKDCSLQIPENVTEHNMACSKMIEKIEQKNNLIYDSGRFQSNY